MSGLMLLVELNTMEISVNTRASQVITPTVNNSLVMALVRMENKNLEIQVKNKPIIGLAVQ